MTRDDGIARIKEQLGFRKTLDAVIVSNMVLAQTMLESAPTKPWFLVSEDSFTTTTALEERLLLPPDFLQEIDNSRLYYRPATWPTEEEVDLIKEDYDLLKKNFVKIPNGPPQAYALLGGYYRLFPRPDAVYTIRSIYFRQDAALTSNVENGWLKYVPYLLLGTTLKQVAKGPVQNTVADSVANDWIAAGLKALYSQNEAREHSNREYQMGGPHA